MKKAVRFYLTVMYTYYLLDGSTRTETVRLVKYIPTLVLPTKSLSVFRIKTVGHRLDIHELKKFAAKSMAFT